METDSVASLSTAKGQDDQLIIILRVEEGEKFVKVMKLTNSVTKMKIRSLK